MFNQDEQRKDLRHLLAPTSRQSLNVIDAARVSKLNARCLELIVHLARSRHAPMPLAVTANRALWCEFDPAARHRTANRSLLLLDLKFAHARWWHLAADGESGNETADAASYLPPIIAADLARETLALAWMLARADAGVATIVCGLAPSVARLFASFNPLDAERLCALHHTRLRLRFDDQPAYWRMHLKSAGGRAFIRSKPEPGEDPQQSLF